MPPIEILKVIPLFRNLSDGDLELIAKHLRQENYPKGETVFRRGDFGDTMYIVESGQVAVLGDDDSVGTIALLGPGSFVGEISLLLTQPRTANLQVMLDAQLWVLRKREFEQLIASRPAIALEMLRELSKRLVKTTHRKQNLSRVRRITAVFGLKGLELANAIHAQLKTPIGVLALPNAQASVETPLSRGVMLLNRQDLTEDTLADRLSHQIEIVRHVVVLLPNQHAPLADKAIDLADTVVSIGRSPAWFNPTGSCELWTTAGSSVSLARIARRLVNRTIGLALSSGGSRGLAHIGVLKVLMEEGIPIDMVAGTSAGALFGALFALGWRVEQLLGFTEELKAATRLTNWDFNFPPRTALVKGKVARDKLIAKWVDHKNFEETQTPIYMVAADAFTGEEVVFDSGPLADAIRASLSIPILAEPWHYQGRYLLDGGIVNPLPASVLRDRGADIVIASSVIQPLAESYQGSTDQMPSILKTISHIYSAMEAEVVKKQLPLIDVLVEHKVMTTHALDFDQAGGLIEIGEEAARQLLPQIKALLEMTPEW